MQAKPRAWHERGRGTGRSLGVVEGSGTMSASERVGRGVFVGLVW